MIKSFIGLITFVAALTALLRFFFKIESFDEFMFQFEKGNSYALPLSLFLSLLITIFNINDFKFKKVKPNENFFEKNTKSFNKLFAMFLITYFVFLVVIMYTNYDLNRPLFHLGKYP